MHGNFCLRFAEYAILRDVSRPEGKSLKCVLIQAKSLQNGLKINKKCENLDIVKAWIQAMAWKLTSLYTAIQEHNLVDFIVASTSKLFLKIPF